MNYNVSLAASVFVKPTCCGVKNNLLIINENINKKKFL